MIFLLLIIWIILLSNQNLNNLNNALGPKRFSVRFDFHTLINPRRYQLHSKNMENCNATFITKKAKTEWKHLRGVCVCVRARVSCIKYIDVVASTLSSMFVTSATTRKTLSHDNFLRQANIIRKTHNDSMSIKFDYI